MIVVVGATGTIGREVVRVLVERGDDVAAITRNPDAARLPDGVHVVAGDPSRPETLAAGLPELDAILVSPRAAAGAVAQLLALAKSHGAKRAVLLSAVTVAHPAGEPRFADEYRNAEQATTASGLDWTFLRCTDFDANALAWAPQIRHGSVVRGAYGGAKTSPIHERDVAAVAVRALTEPARANDAHADAGQAYLLTGPESIDQYDKVRIIAEETGIPLSFEEISPQHMRQAMLAQGVPAEIPDRMLGSSADYSKTPQTMTDTVSQLLGRTALTFRQWVSEHATAFTAESAQMH